MFFPSVRRTFRAFNKMRVAIEGCCHGTLDKIYAEVNKINQAKKIDMLIICGDFQAHRNHSDLECMAVPPKYKIMGDFSKYYTGKARAPVLTIVIGGNHEASNYLWELYHGGWLAPNIYFLGFSGCIQVNGIRIAGSSGIYKSHDYHLGYYEKMPFDNSSMRSIYHTRRYDVSKLSQITRPDIFLSHDWPKSIEHYGNTDELLRRKPHFKEDSLSGTLGSPPMLHLLKTLQPDWWFSAHMHVRFEAKFDHDDSDVSSGSANHLGSHWQSRPIEKNPDEITIDDLDVETDVNPQTFSQTQPRQTKFLALDKCLPGRRFLEIVDIPRPLIEGTNEEGSPPFISFDPEWLAITRALHPYLSLDRYQTPIPPKDELKKLVDVERDWVKQNIPKGGLIEISQIQQFAPTAPGPQPGRRFREQPQIYTNPQTEALMDLLQLPNKINPRYGQVPTQNSSNQPAIITSCHVDPPVIADGTTKRHESSRENEAIDGPSVNRENDVSGGWSPSRVME